MVIQDQALATNVGSGWQNTLRRILDFQFSCNGRVGRIGYLIGSLASTVVGVGYVSAVALEDRRSRNERRRRGLGAVDNRAGDRRRFGEIELHLPRD